MGFDEGNFGGVVVVSGGQNNCLVRYLRDFLKMCMPTFGLMAVRLSSVSLDVVSVKLIERQCFSLFCCIALTLSPNGTLALQHH